MSARTDDPAVVLAKRQRNRTLALLARILPAIDPNDIDGEPDDGKQEERDDRAA